MRRRLGIALAAVVIVAASCSDRVMPPAGPNESAIDLPGAPGFLVTLPPACVTPEKAQRRIDEILPQLFQIGGGRWITATAYNLKLKLARHRGDTEAVRRTVEAFINFTLDAYHAGHVVGGQTPATQAKVLELLYLLYCSNSISPIPDLSGIFTAENTVFVSSASPTTVVSDDLDSAGVRVEQGDVPDDVFGTFISVRRTEAPLPTSLDWYGVDGLRLGAFEFVANPPVAFDEPVLAGVCISFDDEIVSAGDLRLAHGALPGDLPSAPGNTILTTAGGTIEITAYADPGPLGLDCDPLPPPVVDLGFFGNMLQRLAGVVVPDRAYAGTTGGSTGGTVRKFSPFAAVDIKLVTTGSGPSSPQQLLPGTTATLDAPVSVTVTTRNAGTPIDGIPVAFSGSFTPAATVTNVDGTATSTWTLSVGNNTGTGTPSRAPLVFVPATVEYAAILLAPVSIVSPLALPDVAVNTPYPATPFTASGGTGSYTWVVVSGALPAGVTLSTDGVLSGTPTTYGTFTFTVQAVGGASSDSRTYTIVIKAPVTITTTSPLPHAYKGKSYSKTFQATGGTGSYTWSKTGGSLPSGLTLSSSGVLSGTPKEKGTFSFTVRAVSGESSATKTFSLTVKYDY